jgi:murein peptide amidase A
MGPDRLGRWAAVRDNTAGGPVVYLSAGIHGDEPAGPLALIRLIEEDRWPDVSLRIVPCLNPAGMRAGTRENADGIDINRDYRSLVSEEAAGHVEWLRRQPPFDLSLLLHEDWESHGFYCYELIRDGGMSLATAMVAEVSHVCPIDQSDVIDGRSPDLPGIIRPIQGGTLPDRPDWPEAFWLAVNGVGQNYTLEAPSDWPLATRVEALVTAVRAALAARFGPHHFRPIAASIEARS